MKHRRDDFYWWLFPAYVLVVAWRASALATVIILGALIMLICSLFGCSTSRVVDFMSGPYPSVSPYSVRYGHGVYHLYSPDHKQLGTYWDKPTAWAAADALKYGDHEDSKDIEADQ